MNTAPLTTTMPTNSITPAMGQTGHRTNDLVLEMWLHGKARGTQKVYKRIANRFLSFVACDINQVKLEDCQSFLRTVENLAPNTQKNYTAVLKSLLSFSHEIGSSQFNVGKIIKMGKVRDCLNERIMSRDEISEIINNEQSLRNKLILKTMYNLGLRVSEVGSLKWGNIRLKPNGQATLSVFGKGNKTRVLILTKEFLAELSQLKKGGSDYIFISRKKGELSRNQIFNIVKAAGKRVGISDPSPHWYRHSHATHALAGAGENKLKLISDSLGHDSLTTTARYLHANPDDCSSLYIGSI